MTDVETEGEERAVVDTFDATEEGVSIAGAPLAISGRELPLIVLVPMVLVVDMSVSRILLVNVAVEAVEVGFSIGVVFVGVGSAFWGRSFNLRGSDSNVVVEAGVGLTVEVAA